MKPWGKLEGLGTRNFEEYFLLPDGSSYTESLLTILDGTWANLKPWLVSYRVPEIAFTIDEVRGWHE